MEENKKFTCPACGYKVFQESVGSDDICPLCFWHDDLIDLEKMYEPMGPNKVSLEEAQKNFEEFGAVERRLLPYVKSVGEEEKDKDWRVLDRTKDMERRIDPSIEDKKQLYYWYW